MSTLQLDVGDLKPRAVEFTASELVVTLVGGRKIATPIDWYPRLQARLDRAACQLRNHADGHSLAGAR